ncbi:hypothetical protein, partial [Nocardia cyriacigeorgica]|uniref:hypothetical protein n=1 Tax=Nocardia cyriacigeorgica TaxID=135487 RepID=UPI002455B19F
MTESLTTTTSAAPAARPSRVVAHGVLRGIALALGGVFSIALRTGQLGGDGAVPFEAVRGSDLDHHFRVRTQIVRPR